MDYVCSGSGLVSFPQLIKAILEKNPRARDSIAGMFSKTNSGKISTLSEELDIGCPIDLDYSDHHESFRRLDFHPSLKPVIFLETSRGCYWRKCHFCSLNEDRLKYRVKQEDKAIEEINRYFKKYDCHIEMVDNVLPRHYIKNVLPYLRVPKERFLIYEVRADYSEEEMKILKQAGVRLIQPGIESFSSVVLQLMNKGINAFQSIRMLKLGVKYLFLNTWNLMTGFPGMTAAIYEQLNSTMTVLAHLYPPQAVYPLRIEQYSTYWLESEKYHLELTPLKFYEDVYPYDKEFIANIAYSFEEAGDSSERMRLFNRYYPELNAAVEQWKKRWSVKFAADLPKLYCYQPCPGDVVKDHFPGESPAAVARALVHLINRGLLFKEGEQVMSLTIDDYPEELFKQISAENYVMFRKA